MAKATRGSKRRDEALSRERIVDAAIALLDAEGERGLTFRALAARLATGPGAIYWHVANKSELLVAASDAVVARALAGVRSHATPRKAIRSIAMSVFAAIDAHPWLGAELSRGPWQTAMLQLFERIGREVQALRAPRRTQFTAASALASYIVGVGGQNEINGRSLEPREDRDDLLEAESARWQALDAHAYPFTRSVATRLRNHDDRTEFLAGIDLILAGIAASL
jgi:AcrR family transcriptional regulator